MLKFMPGMHGSKIEDFRDEVATEIIGFFKQAMPELKLKMGRLSGGPGNPLVIYNVIGGFWPFETKEEFGGVTSWLGTRAKWVITILIFDKDIAKRANVLEFIAKLGAKYKKDNALLTFSTGTPEKPEKLYKAF